MRGLRTWRRELRGKADFEAARGLIRATYRLREEIATARSPLISGAEYPSGYESPAPNEHPDPRAEAEALAHVYHTRWTRVSNALQEFDAQTLEAEALWGGEIRKRTQALRTCAVALFVAMTDIVENKASGGEHFEQDREYARHTRARAHGVADDKENLLSNEIAATVTALEESLRPHLARPK